MATKWLLTCILLRKGYLGQYRAKSTGQSHLLTQRRKAASEDTIPLSTFLDFQLPELLKINFLFKFLLPKFVKLYYGVLRNEDTLITPCKSLSSFF